MTTVLSSDKIRSLALRLSTFSCFTLRSLTLSFFDNLTGYDLVRTLDAQLSICLSTVPEGMHECTGYTIELRYAWNICQEAWTADLFEA